MQFASKEAVQGHTRDLPGKVQEGDLQCALRKRRAVANRRTDRRIISFLRAFSSNGVLPIASRRDG